MSTCNDVASKFLPEFEFLFLCWPATNCFDDESGLLTAKQTKRVFPVDFQQHVVG